MVKMLQVPYFCCIVFLCSILADTEGVKYKAKLSPNYTLVWETVDNEFINFAALVKTTGWVGLGLNTKPKMDGADLVISGVKNDTRPYLFAYHGIGHHLIEEETSHWDIGYGRVFEDWNATVTLVNMIRPLDSNHKDGINIEDKDMYLLWSYGLDDDVSKKHVERGVIRVNFISPSSSNNNPDNIGIL